MAFQLLKNSLKKSDVLSFVFRDVAEFSTSQRYLSKVLVSKDLKTLQNPEQIKHEERLRNELIPERVTVDISKASGVPEEHTKGRRVRIYKFSKNAMQSGTHNVGVWQMDFEVRKRWENPLMGWTSTGDPLSNMRVEFSNKDEAIKFAEKNGWEWFLDEGTPSQPKVKSYSFNFSWNNKTRVSTK